MTWWREAVFYQIYPRSFLDTDGDGVGDLEGVRQKIPYLRSLGVDALWISPIFPSPMKDFGYDVADYCDVDPVFGSLEQFDQLLSDAHDAGLRVILDWVPNHTSSEHPWFQESRSSLTNAKRDWYVWREPSPSRDMPNNWLRSWSDQPAWTLDDITNQYYLHCFLPDQPDLNWANVEVRRAMAQTLRFWLDRGVDGFRMDVIHLIGKDPELANDPEELRALGHVPLNDRVETHGYLREIRELLASYEGDRVSVGEVYLLDPESVSTYYGLQDELHLSFNFMSLITPWRAEAWKELIDRTERAHQARGAWPTWTLSNHDNRRVASRIGNIPIRSRTALVLLLSLRGTPFLYAGEELGLLDAVIPVDRVVDPGGRDGCRAPIPWTERDHYGWPVDPWLPFVEQAEQFCVATQERADDSILKFCRRLLHIRRSSIALRSGEILDVEAEDGVLQFDRRSESEHLRVIVNFTREDRRIDVTSSATVVFSSSGNVTIAANGLTLEPGDATLLRL